MALDVAAAALQGVRRLEDIPQGLGAGFTVGREVVERGDELVTFVGQTVGLVPLRDSLHVRLLPALPLVGIQDLKRGDKRESVSIKQCFYNEAMFRGYPYQVNVRGYRLVM